MTRFNDLDIETVKVKIKRVKIKPVKPSVHIMITERDKIQSGPRVATFAVYHYVSQLNRLKNCGNHFQTHQCVI